MTVIAIDGPGGAGKSTLAWIVARRLSTEWLDTGAMYRAVALLALRRGIDPVDEDALVAAAQTMHLEVSSSVVLDGEDVTAVIRTAEVDAIVSLVAAHPAVRQELVDRQRAWMRTRDIGVVEGRDIGTVVFPDADVKVYLTADESVRATRRAEQIRVDLDQYEDNADAAASIAEHRAAIERRDRLDRGRSSSPLVRAPDAIVIDSTLTGPDAIADLVCARLRTDGQGGC